MDAMVVAGPVIVTALFGGIFALLQSRQGTQGADPSRGLRIFCLFVSLTAAALTLNMSLNMASAGEVLVNQTVFDSATNTTTYSYTHGNAIISASESSAWYYVVFAGVGGLAIYYGFVMLAVGYAWGIRVLEYAVGKKSKRDWDFETDGKGLS